MSKLFYTTFSRGTLSMNKNVLEVDFFFKIKKLKLDF